jgi:hypothetical protein
MPAYFRDVFYCLAGIQKWRALGMASFETEEVRQRLSMQGCFQVDILIPAGAA